MITYATLISSDDLLKIPKDPHIVIEMKMIIEGEEFNKAIYVDKSLELKELMHEIETKVKEVGRTYACVFAGREDLRKNNVSPC